MLTFLHTALVFLDLYIFFPDTVGGLLTSSSPVATGTALTFFAIIGFGALGEMALAGIIVPSLGLVLDKVMPRLGK